MKRKQLFVELTELDDQLLAQYFTMDKELARKHARKRMRVRVLAVAACVAILLCACVPAGMLSNPVGRAVLQGDSEALTQELMKIDGFVLWQDKMAGKLEQTLPQPLWTLMQDLPVVNVLAQSQFAGLSAQDTFEDGKPYRLYFVSGGDGTCTLEYITTAPGVTEDFVIEIPETSPAGDIVTAIDIDQFTGVKQSHVASFPYVLTAQTLQALCEVAKQNGISNFELEKLRAYYLNLSVAGLDDIGREELANIYPIAEMGDVYVFDLLASSAEVSKIYGYLTKYCEWDEEKYEQSVSEVVQLAKQSGSRESAELCLTILRDAALSCAVGITIPKTVSSINNAMWANLPSLETVTVAEENPTLKMIDGCLVDTATGTLKLYLREDGDFPTDVDIRIMDPNAFLYCRLQPNAQGEVALRIPEGVIQIGRHCFANDALVEDQPIVHIYLPASLKFFGGEKEYSHAYQVIYNYPGTLAEWESNVVYGKVDKHDCIYLHTSDMEQPFFIIYPQ